MEIYIVGKKEDVENEFIDASYDHDKQAWVVNANVDLNFTVLEIK